MKESEWSWNYEKIGSVLEGRLEAMNNRLLLAEIKSQEYAIKYHDLEKQIKNSEDIRKDLSEKSNDLELQLSLKKREWTRKDRDFKKGRTDLEAQLVDVKNRAKSDKEQYSNKFEALKKEIEDHKSQCTALKRQLILKELELTRKEQEFQKEKRELETELKDGNTRLQSVESSKSQSSTAGNFLEKQNEEPKSELQCCEVETNEQTNLNSPNPSPGKSTSLKSTESGFEGKEHKYIYFCLSKL